MSEQVKVNVIGETGDFYYNEETIVKTTMQYPKFKVEGAQSAVNQINGFYLQRADEFRFLVRSRIFPAAVMQYEDPDRGRTEMPEYEAMLDFEKTYEDGCTVSLYTDEYQYMGGAHGNTVRSSDTWELKSGYRYRLEDLFPEGNDYRGVLTGEIIRQIAAAVAQGDQSYFDDYENLVLNTFQEENFYLRADGLVIYFQQYDIAPYSSGIQEFVIPYSIQGPIRPVC